MPSEYVSNRTFNLNFEDHRNSVVVKQGDSVSFDGRVAIYIPNGTSGVGRSLGKAIDIGWLTKKETKSSKKSSNKKSSKKDTAKKENKPRATYDPKIGGEFEEFLRQENDTKVLTEDELIVKKTKTRDEIHTGKMEVSVEEAAVKENVTVSSSTATPKTKAHSKEVISADVNSSIDMKNTPKAKEESKKNSFTVDETTPRIQDGASPDEIKRVVKVDLDQESQGATVVKKMGSSQTEVQEMDGVTLRRPDTTPKDTKITTTTAASAGDGMPNQGARVVGTIGGKKDGKKTEPLEPQDAKVVGRVGEKKGRTKTTTKTASKKAPSKKKSTHKKAVKTTSDDQDYLSKLPDGWGDLHWVKKEKFILELEDIGFIKFIMSVETLNAVQKACKKRLEQLEGNKS